MNNMTWWRKYIKDHTWNLLEYKDKLSLMDNVCLCLISTYMQFLTRILYLGLKIHESWMPACPSGKQLSNFACPGQITYLGPCQLDKREWKVTWLARKSTWLYLMIGRRQPESTLFEPCLRGNVIPFWYANWIATDFTANLLQSSQIET